MTKHRRRTITHGEWTDDVDEGIADLILECWRADVAPWGSCQDVEGKIWIGFFSALDAEAFMDIAAAERSTDLDSLYQHAQISSDEDDDDARARHPRTIKALQRHEPSDLVTPPPFSSRQFCISSVSAGRVTFWAPFWRFPAPTERPTLSKFLMQVRRRAPGSVHACEADPDPLRHVRS